MSSYKWKKEHNYYQRLYSKYRTLILDYYGNKCNNCNRLYSKLVIDHVYNDGRNDRYGLYKGSGGHGYYQKLWKQIEQGQSDRFQLLCYTCHNQKHHKVI